MSGRTTSRLFRALDRLLEKTVLLSYTNVGYLLRRRTWDDADLEVDLRGRHCIVTGANSGLGYAVSERLADLGASLTLLVRNRARGQEAQAAIRERTGNPNVALAVVDVSDLEAVREFAERFTREQERLDVLIHNAGVLLEERQLSADGIEMTFATNVLGPFLLTQLLLPKLKESAPARVIFVSSGGMYTQKLDVEDLQSERGAFNGTRAYAQTKRAQVMLTELWAERLAGTGVTVNAMHPGWVDTPGLRRSLPTFSKLTWLGLRTPLQGADTILWLAVAPSLDGESGKFWFDRRERETHKLARTRASEKEYQQLWDACTRLSGLEIAREN